VCFGVICKRHLRKSLDRPFEGTSFTHDQGQRVKWSVLGSYISLSAGDQDYNEQIAVHLMLAKIKGERPGKDSKSAVSLLLSILITMNLPLNPGVVVVTVSPILK